MQDTGAREDHRGTTHSRSPSVQLVQVRRTTTAPSPVWSAVEGVEAVQGEQEAQVEVSSTSRPAC